MVVRHYKHITNDFIINVQMYGKNNVLQEYWTNLVQSRTDYCVIKLLLESEDPILKIEYVGVSPN